jgi:hypothetical protein
MTREAGFIAADKAVSWGSAEKRRSEAQAEEPVEAL